MNLSAVIPAKAGISANTHPHCIFAGECLKKKLSSKNENSRIFKKNNMCLDEIPAFAGMTGSRLRE
jgi:hypothetical protein